MLTELTVVIILQYRESQGVTLYTLNLQRYYVNGLKTGRKSTKQKNQVLLLSHPREAQIHKERVGTLQLHPSLMAQPHQQPLGYNQIRQDYGFCITEVPCSSVHRMTQQEGTKGKRQKDDTQLMGQVLHALASSSAKLHAPAHSPGLPSHACRRTVTSR